jgi:Protein kinase domain
MGRNHSPWVSVIGQNACVLTRSGAQRLVPGDVVDDFLIEAVVAEGGTTTTFRAGSQSLGREVVLKHFHPEAFMGDGGSSVADAREAASAVARLEHPAITPVFAAGEWGGGIYVASAQASGPTLEAALADNPRTPQQTADLVEQLAGALEHAHAAGIVHRDVRPECVTLGRWGNVMLRDFGVTRASGRTGVITRADVLASMRYTAPELILGRPATAAADTFGLAATAVAALTGMPPFSDAAPAEYVVMRAGAEPPRIAERGGAELDEISAAIGRGMALDPADRPSPSEFAAELAAAVAALPARLRAAPAPMHAVAAGAEEPIVPAVGYPAAPPPNAGDVTRIEHRRPMAAATQHASSAVGWRTWASVATIALTIGVFAALVAFLTAPDPPQAVRLGVVRVTPPDGWLVDEAGSPTVRRAGGLAATLALAPARLPGAPLPPDVVDRVAPARARAGDRQIVLYDGGEDTIAALPTTKGTLYARCGAAVGAERCAALVTQHVEGAEPVSVVPNARAAEALRTAMSDVQQQGGVALGEMSAAKAEDRANGANALAGTLRNAAGALAVDGVDAGTSAALGQVAKALAAEAGALAQYSSALDRQSAAAQRAARAAASSADARLRTALERFRVAGYEVEG